MEVVATHGHLHKNTRGATYLVLVDIFCLCEIKFVCIYIAKCDLVHVKTVFHLHYLQMASNNLF